MNSSVDFVQSEKAEKGSVIHRGNACDSESNMVPEVIYRHQIAAHPGTSWVSGVPTKTAARPMFTTKESLGDRLLPPLPQAAVCSEHERQAILFVDGEDAPARRRGMEACMHRIGVARCRKLLFRCKQGEVDVQLGSARAWAEDILARYPSRAIVVGIDGIDQWLRSPHDVACKLQSIVSVGAAVVCAVDSRYGDFRLLTFHLRILGIMVIREPHLPERVTSVSTGPAMLRLSPEAEFGPSVRRFPGVQPPALAAYASELQNVDAQPTRNNRANQRTLKRIRTSEGGTLSAFSEYKRGEYARAYRNDFAINRLLRELLDV